VSAAHTLITPFAERGGMLLQLGLPGVAEFFLLNVVIAAVVGYFTYRDAESRGEHATLWAGVMAAASFFLSFVGFLVVFLVYYVLVVRD
jgi:hypothetical protein